MNTTELLSAEAVAADIRIGNDALVIAGLTAERDELRAALAERDASLENTRVQLAGCGVAAMQNTEASKADRVKPGDYGWSESYGDVCRAVDREIDLRAKLAALEGAYIPTYLERLAASPATLEAEFTALRSEALDLRAALAERDAKLAALEGQEPVALLAQGISKGVVGAAKLYFPQERQEAIEFCTAAHEKGGYPVTEIRPLYAAAGAAPVPEDWRSAVAMAYGHLWHINNEPMAPIPLRSEESASYAARKLLRDLLTTEERGEAINSVRAMLKLTPKEPT